MISKLGKYEIRGELGRGAMGVVYEGFDPMIHRIVAIKTIRADRLGGNESATAIARFRSEAQAAGRLTHPNIVAIYDFDIDGDTWFIAMESVKGRELKEYFDGNERFAITDIVRIMAQILAALDYSHRQGVIHRDIKPANIFILTDGTAKVADFGIARLDSSTLTQVGDVLGTPAYMSPEQIMGLPVDGRSDLFSAGVLLYQFLTGERPFAGSANTIMQKVLKEEPLPPSSLNVQLPSAMDAVVRKALAKKPADRFQTAKEFADALQAATADDPDATVRATPSGATASRPSAAPIPVAAAPGPAPVPAKSSQTTAIAIVVGALVIAGVAGGWWWSQRAAAPSVVARAPTSAGPGSAPATAATNGQTAPAGQPAPGVTDGATPVAAPAAGTSTAPVVPSSGAAATAGASNRSAASGRARSRHHGHLRSGPRRSHRPALCTGSRAAADRSACGFQAATGVQGARPDARQGRARQELRRAADATASAKR